ncbi:MAG: MarR family winged helix-turn-helix transcriptional regulator [Spirochaetia bacterium]|nr:MarR family winged helix-turn-helix transcriptional regulator [Spirochaetia bacterium]
MKAKSLEQADYKRAALSCFNFSFRNAARTVTLLYDRALSSAGIRSTQYSLMVVLAGYGSLTINELAAGLGLDRTTLSKNLRPMVKRRLIQLGPMEDRRKKALILTKAGYTLLEECGPLWSKAQEQVQGILGEDARDVQRKLVRVARTRAN